MSSTTIFTIASKNYLAHVRTLMKSVLMFHPDIDTYLVLVDEVEGRYDPDHERFKTVRARDLGIPDFVPFSFKYSILELNTAVKPFAFARFLDQGYRKIVYLDPDIRLYSSLGMVLGLLNTHSVLLTPHMTAPLDPADTAEPNERMMCMGGAYNLGFIAVSAAAETRRLISWWSRKCLDSCYQEPEHGLFVDQKWMDLVPGMFDGVHVFRDIGHNVAYWNLHERRLAGTMVNDSVPLVFYHFSGFECDHPETISHFQNRSSLASRPDLAPLCLAYRDELAANGYEECRTWTYAYGRYRNGRGIGPMARRLYTHVADRYPDPYAVGKGSYYEFLRRRGLLEEATSIVPLPPGERAVKSAGVNRLLRMACRVLGPDRYRALMNYLRHTAIVRNQTFLLGKACTGSHSDDGSERRACNIPAK